mgnify:CR=1 FL=1|tara:strand:- start:4894 stop:5064 length:171 start_codon:yes stop_codon:yes gene_type:complete
MANIHQRRRAQRIAILEAQRLARLDVTVEEQPKEAEKPKKPSKVKKKISDIFKKDK